MDLAELRAFLPPELLEDLRKSRGILLTLACLAGLQLAGTALFLARGWLGYNKEEE